MRHKDEKQFPWTKDDRKWISTWRPSVQRNFNTLTRQVARFRESIPQLGNAAEKAAKPFLTTAEKLLRLARQRVFQPISRDQAGKIRSRLSKSHESWVAFTNSRETSEAIREANRRIKKANRQHRQLIDAKGREIAAALTSPDWTAKFDEVAGQCEHNVDEMVEMARSLKQSGSQEDVPILKRLSRVWLIRATYDFSKPRQAELGEYIATEQPKCMRDLLRHAIYLEYRHCALKRLKRPESFIPGMNDPQETLVACQASVFNGLCHTLDRWKKHGQNSKSLTAREFNVCGLDCRVGSLAESSCQNAKKCKETKQEALKSQSEEDRSGKSSPGVPLGGKG